MIGRVTLGDKAWCQLTGNTVVARFISHPLLPCRGSLPGRASATGLRSKKRHLQHWLQERLFGVCYGALGGRNGRGLARGEKCFPKALAVYGVKIGLIARLMHVAGAVVGGA